MEVASSSLLGVRPELGLDESTRIRRETKYAGVGLLMVRGRRLVRSAMVVIRGGIGSFFGLTGAAATLAPDTASSRGVATWTWG